MARKQPLLIVARSYQDATRRAKALGLDRCRWTFVGAVDVLKVVRSDDVKVEFVDGWKCRQDANQILFELHARKLLI